jgi:hypothetical protein
LKNLRNYLFGPEAWWLVVYAATLLLAGTNEPPTVEGNQRLELIGWFWGPLAALISFATLWWLRSKWWGLARVFTAGCVGVFFVTTALCGAMRYDDSRDSGVGTAWMVFIMFGWMTIGGASVIAAIVIALTSRSRRATDVAASGASLRND